MWFNSPEKLEVSVKTVRRILYNQKDKVRWQNEEQDTGNLVDEDVCWKKQCCTTIEEQYRPEANVTNITNQ